MESKYHIYFSNMHLERLGQLELPAIVFSPSLDDWNDFGYLTRFSYPGGQVSRARGGGGACALE
jgi:hypothetical protein